MIAPILIVGGYGVVGAQLAELIRKRNPQLPLLLAGRSQEQADLAAARIGNASGVAIDVTSADPLAGMDARLGAVIAAANDPANALLKAAVSRKIPYIDITRWTERLLQAQSLADEMQPGASVTLASSWMAGLSAILAMHASDGIPDIEEIRTTVLFRLNDKAGPNSIEYADRLSVPFRIWRLGAWQMVRPLTDPVRTAFPSGETAKAYRFDEPSQETLVGATGARSVSSRIAYDSASTMRTMVIMVRSGLWSMISGRMFTKLRHSLIYHPGEGAAHEFVIDVAGKDIQRQASMLDPAGQTHLTAVGAYIQLCEAAGLEGRPPRRTGVHFPEYETDFGFARKVLEEEGVSVQVTESRAPLIPVHP